MIKTLTYYAVVLICGTVFTACATTSPEAYLSAECDDLRTLVQAQDYTATIRGQDSFTDRNMEEIRQESGSPWAGRTRTRDDSNLRDERQAIREAYRRKGCKA